MSHLRHNAGKFDFGTPGNGFHRIEIQVKLDRDVFLGHFRHHVQ